MKLDGIVELHDYVVSSAICRRNAAIIHVN
jgi:hypothetical protein